MAEPALVQIDSRGFILLTPRGVLSTEQVAECSRTLRGLPQFAEGLPVLVDLSLVTQWKLEAETVVSFAMGAQKDENRVAVFAEEPAMYGMARMYEMVADLTESRVGVFQDQAAALSWLGV